VTLFRSQIEALVAAGVRFVVVGGVAAGLHGSTRVTFDLDICYDPAPDNLERLGTVLKRWGVYLRGVEEGLPFTMDARQLAVTPIMTLTSSLGDIDIMPQVQGVGDFERVLAKSVETTVGDTSFRILDLPALIRAKRAVGRPKDHDQLPELEGLLELKRRRDR
jgi:hypothetical protein